MRPRTSPRTFDGSTPPANPIHSPITGSGTCAGPHGCETDRPRSEGCGSLRPAMTMHGPGGQADTCPYIHVAENPVLAPHVNVGSTPVLVLITDTSIPRAVN